MADYIVIDFDGTCTTHEYPKIGKDIGAIPVLRKLVDNGHKLILFTMRSGKELQDAVDWFSRYQIPLFGINTNPTQGAWTTSPKAYGHLYLDDAGLGCPLKQDYSVLPNIAGMLNIGESGYDKQSIETPIGRPYVDWPKVEEMLIEKGYINKK